MLLFLSDNCQFSFLYGRNCYKLNPVLYGLQGAIQALCSNCVNLCKESILCVCTWCTTLVSSLCNTNSGHLMQGTSDFSVSWLMPVNIIWSDFFPSVEVGAMLSVVHTHWFASTSIIVSCTYSTHLSVGLIYKVQLWFVLDNPWMRIWDLNEYVYTWWVRFYCVLSHRSTFNSGTFVRIILDVLYVISFREISCTQTSSIFLKKEKKKNSFNLIAGMQVIICALSYPNQHVVTIITSWKDLK